MSKAILVLDEMPKECIYCPCFRVENNEFNANFMDCEAVHRLLTVEERDNKPSWCPLKPLPQLINDLDLEIWNSTKGQILAPKGTFDEIYEDKDNESDS